MTAKPQDIWSKWLLQRRDGEDPAARRRGLELLRPIRDRVLDNAAIGDGDRLLDVGCGDGLIAFGALERMGSGKVVFSDVSQDLLDHCEKVAAELDVSDRCEFVLASAEDLSSIPDQSVSIVTTRSVLIYVEDKKLAFQEFHRVLRPAGRFSLFEPINSFGYPEPEDRFAGFDVSPVVDLAQKVKAAYPQARAGKPDPMVDFDERDLLRLAQEAGFEDLHLRLEADVGPHRTGMNWDSYLHRAPNPLAPTLQEAVEQTLDASEAKEFLTHLRPLVENEEAIREMAVVYLWGKKVRGG